MRKLIYFISLIVIGITLTGCQSKRVKQTTNDLGQAKQTKQLVMTPISAKTVSHAGKKKIVQIQFKVKNKSVKKFQVGASDFIIKYETHYFYMGEGINFAATLAPSKATKGNGFYEIPARARRFTLLYKPLDVNQTAKWQVTVK
ncbi:hypothetical protein [Latilactobacillus graminis]|uniref:DUF4352 domain-containing protein n=2 Tax=Latilactobacillus graminis TaxID=60519 RepID=A0AA89KWN8_9LACO|nr:hypothetical protein [Latilactobacillus graminis]KRM21193.1 hypothetical protein FC90_GL001730 [Latilactobacillus graminis DSM 20719]QFP79319.1 DUF4352 domain-containing protein [Latilactobacillus graminis]